MSRPYAKYTAKTTFAQLKEPLYASDYIANKKMKNLFCKPNYCRINTNVNSEGNHLLIKKSNQQKNNPCDYIDHTQLYINLITKLDLTDVNPIISDLSGNTYPVIIDTNTEFVEPYLTYNIDPSGNLFGNTLCGIDNFQNYIVYNPPSKNNNPDHIDNL